MTQPFLDKRTLLFSLLQAASVLFITLAVLVAAHSLGEPESNIRALTFTTLAISNLALILANRSWTFPIIATGARRIPRFGGVIGGALTVLGFRFTCHWRVICSACPSFTT